MCDREWLGPCASGIGDLAAKIIGMLGVDAADFAFLENVSFLDKDCVSCIDRRQPLMQLHIVGGQ